MLPFLLFVCHQFIFACPSMTFTFTRVRHANWPEFVCSIYTCQSLVISCTFQRCVYEFSGVGCGGVICSQGHKKMSLEGQCPKVTRTDSQILSRLLQIISRISSRISLIPKQGTGIRDSYNHTTVF